MLRSIWRFAVPVAAIALLGLAPAARAATVSLASLLVPGATIQSGDKLFSNFTYVTTGIGMPTAGNVGVTAIGTGLGTDYLGIQFSGPFADGDPTILGADALIGYTVTVLGSDFLITDAHMNSNVNATQGDVFAQIAETFTAVTPPTPPLNSQTVVNASVHNGIQILSADVVFGAGYKQINVQKDIQINWLNGGVVPTMSFVNQTFSQTAVVPLPSTANMGIALLGVLGGFGAIRRMRKEGQLA
jgi:hypothetical protein